MWPLLQLKKQIEGVEEDTLWLCGKRGAILRNLNMKNFLKFSLVLDSEQYGSWPSVPVTLLSLSSNEGGGLFHSAIDWFLQRFNQSFQVLSQFLALFWPLLSWSLFFPPAHSKSALLEMVFLSHSWWELCVLLGVRWWICDLCSACLTVSGDGALFACNQPGCAVLHLGNYSLVLGEHLSKWLF